MNEKPIYLVEVTYDDEFKADEARIIVKKARAEGISDVQETAVVVHERSGKKVLTQDVDLEGKRRTQGHWLGIAAAFATGTMPLIMVGTVAGEVIGRLTDKGIRTGQLKTAGRELAPGTSALFVLAHEAVPRGALAKRLQPLGGHVMRTTLSQETASELEHLLQESA
jgi:uncharacterized membrane protein